MLCKGLSRADESKPRYLALCSILLERLEKERDSLLDFLLVRGCCLSSR